MAKEIGVRIDRTSPVPLYHQVAEQLAAAVNDGELQPGDPFENVADLSERLRVSRPTVRRAVQELVSRGLLLRRRGMGTMVANRKIHRRAELTSLWDDLVRAGASPTTTVLSHDVLEDERAATALDLPPETRLLRVARIRSSGTTPVALLCNWLPPPLTDITREELELQGLYAILRARGVRPVVAHQSIGARMPSAAERRHLQLPPDEPVLTMTRSAFDSAGKPVEYGDHCYKGSGYAIEVVVDER